MTRLAIPDMTCGHCKASVEAALKSLPDAGDVSVDLAGRTVTATGPAPAQTLLKALDDIGFPASVVAA